VREIGPVGRIVVATGQRPDLTITRELRLDLARGASCARSRHRAHRGGGRGCGDYFLALQRMFEGQDADA
jgi:hypothetical protein